MSNLHVLKSSLKDYFGRVRGYLGTDTEYWILKSVDSDSSELDVLRVLLSCRSPENHTVPAEIIPCGSTHLILMPYVETLLDVPWTSIDEVIDAIEQCLTVRLLDPFDRRLC